TASMTYTKTTILAATPLQITNASLVLDNTNTGAIGNININPNMTLVPKATTAVDFFGNLDSFQQAGAGALTNAASGGVLMQWQGPGANVNPVLPTGLAAATYRAADTALNANGEFVQAADFNVPIVAGGATSFPAVTAASTLPAVVLADVGTYAWEQQPPITPALTTQMTTFDSLGNARSVTVQFYQVNDLGAGAVNAAAGP